MKLNLWVWICSDGILLKVRLSQPLVQSDTLRRRGCLVVVGESETKQQQKTISQLIFKAETFSTWEEWWSCWMLSTWVSRWDVTTASWGRPKGAKYTSLHLSSQHLLSLFSLFHTITILWIVIPGAFGEQTNLEALRWKLSSFFARRQNWVSWPFVCNVIWNEEFVFFLQKGRNQTCPQELPKLVAGRTAHELFEPFKFQGPSNFNIVIIAQVMIGKNRSGRSLGANLFIGDWWPRRFPTYCFRCASWWRE